MAGGTDRASRGREPRWPWPASRSCGGRWREPAGGPSLIAVGTLALVLLPRPASAHLVTTGLGPVYDGISHVLMSPDDLVPIIALALLAGLNGPAAGRSALFALTAAWLAGGVLGFSSPQRRCFPPATTTVSFLLLGGLTALDRRLSPRVVAALAVAIGLLHGWLNGVSLAAGAARGHRPRRHRERDVRDRGDGVRPGRRPSALRGRGIAVRVAGSWVAAIGLLMLGWSLRP